MDSKEVLHLYESFFNVLKTAEESSEEVFAWFTDIPHPLFNTIMHVNSEENLSYYSSKSKQAISIWTHEFSPLSKLQNFFQKYAYHLTASCPLMAYNLDFDEITKVNKHIEITRDEIFYRIVATAFSFDETIKNSYKTLFEQLPEVENYLIFEDSVPVGAGSLHPKQNIGAIFNVGVLPTYQKKGYGRLLVEFLLNRARELNLIKIILQSTPIGVNLYTRLGFKKILDVDIYVKQGSKSLF
ncbi:MAG: hypothetical protein Tsb0021_00870 [Chlamydiales bacterium]